MAQALATALLASVVVWSLLPLTPGDPAARYLSAQGIVNATAAERASARAELGLDRSLPVQYAGWLSGVVQGDLDRSYRSGLPVADELGARFGATLRLAVLAIGIGLVTALPLGLLSAAFRGRSPDSVVRASSVAFTAVPSFVLGLVVVQVVVLGRGIGAVVGDAGWGTALLPAACLGVGAAARWARLLRAGVIQAERAQYSLVARARGATRFWVLTVHALPNASVPVLTVVGLDFGYLVGGAAIIETVFSRPGIGQLLAQAVLNRDLPVIQAFTLLAALTYVVVSLGVDLLTGLIDGRTRATVAA